MLTPDFAVVGDTAHESSRPGRVGCGAWNTIIEATSKTSVRKHSSFFSPFSFVTFHSESFVDTKQKNRRRIVCA